jgi:chemotaxis protein MotB
MSGDGGHGGGGHAKRRGHEEEHEEHENHERWLVSYADMMTLLMVLFIVMFAISQVDQKKFMALKTGLSAGFGSPVSMLSGADSLLQDGTSVAPDTPNLAGVAGTKLPDPAKDAAAKSASAEDWTKTAQLVDATAKAQVAAQVDTLKKAEAQLQKALQAAGMAQGATFRFNEQGLVVSIATDKVLFDSGGATLLPSGRRILDAIAPTLLKLPNQLSIDGHTDANPIHTAAYPDNWALASARADGVLRYLASTHDIPYSRMSSTSYADTEPLAPGNSAAAMAINRRVEIVVLAVVDNSAGRAIENLGNTAKATAKAVASSASTSTAGTASSSTAVHNLLGPDATSATAGAKARAAAAAAKSAAASAARSRTTRAARSG